MGLTKPTLLAFLICDLIIVDENSKKKTLVGVFSDITVPGFPCVHQSMALYFSLTNAEGTYDFIIRLVHSDSDTQIGEARMSANIIDITKKSDFGFNVPPIKLLKEGRYEFQLWADGELLGRQEFGALLVKEK